MTLRQPGLFELGPPLPQGFRYQPDLVGPDDERALLEQFSALPFTEFEFRGFLGRRRVVSFGWQYHFGVEQLKPAADIPPFLHSLRARAAAFAEVDPTNLQHVLITEYGPGAAIGWHKDKAVFDDVVGISLLSPCLFRLRQKAGTGSRRASLKLEPRSAYVLHGPSRTEWEHSIPAVDSLRYSVTFRSLRRA